MTRTEHLLTILAEECNEIAQRATKALRFGLHEIQPGQQHTNADRIIAEYADYCAAFSLLVEEDALPIVSQPIWLDMVDVKRAKIEKYLLYSKQLGLLSESAVEPSKEQRGS